jgi:hypothetical protein
MSNSDAILFETSGSNAIVTDAKSGGYSKPASGTYNKLYKKTLNRTFG